MAEQTVIDLETVLKSMIKKPLDRSTAATLTVAFEIRKAIAAYKNETKTDEAIRAEIQRIYFEFNQETDAELAFEVAQERQQNPRKF